MTDSKRIEELIAWLLSAWRDLREVDESLLVEIPSSDGKWVETLVNDGNVFQIIQQLNDMLRGKPPDQFLGPL
jgi:hypothetical protein